MRECLIGLGSNLGDRVGYLTSAWRFLGRTDGIETVRLASFYETEPVGGPRRQACFLNSVGRIRTSLSPYSLLDVLLDVERRLNRVRTVRWGPRTIDLDLLFYADVEIDDPPRLVLPHPRLVWRNFVLEPASEIAPDWRHPTTGLSLSEHRRLLVSSLATPYFFAGYFIPSQNVSKE